ncbi:MAG: TIGR01212 family radical SAM protein [Chitinispirillaceae bacterium]|nr:TIGR01212 family radical SAM protein [Chitinispirillaceae bacterium]
MLHYNSYSAYLKKRFGVPVVKVPVSGGFSCPNRDGTIHHAGCVFCDNRAFSPVAGVTTSPLEQVRSFIKRQKRRGGLYIAYLQPYSNTYGSVSDLKAVYEPLIREPGIVGLSIGTRPDCFSEDIYAYLSDLAGRTALTVELGVQSAHDQTLLLINRGHTFDSFVGAVRRLSVCPIEIVAHVILGLPGETPAMMFETADHLAALPVHGVKFHQLMVIHGTVLARWYDEGRVAPLGIEEYAPIISGCIERLRPDQHVHRIMSDTSRERGLIVPDWSADKQGSIRFLQEYMTKHGVEQGRNWKGREAAGNRL